MNHSFEIYTVNKVYLSNRDILYHESTYLDKYIIYMLRAVYRPPPVYRPHLTVYRLYVKSIDSTEFHKKQFIDPQCL